MIEIHLHVHEHADPQTLEALVALARQVATLESQGATLMTKASEILDLLQQIDTRTTQLGTISTEVAAGLTEVRSDLQALRDQIGNGSGISETDAEAIKLRIAEIDSRLGAATTSLQGQAAELTALGQDPANPVPPPAPGTGEQPPAPETEPTT